MTEPAIQAIGAGKAFRVYPNGWARALEWATLGARVHHRLFWALKGVDLAVMPGQCVGVIGANGSGKTTLLKLIAGALHPTEGTARTRGRVLSLIELGAGVTPELTGRQNIHHLAAMLDFPPDFCRKNMDAVEDFAQLGEFFDRPVSVYSTGMRVRLAFSLFARFRPDVFLIDEALSVGDVHFQQKCAARIRELIQDGVAMLLVSHDTQAVLALCESALLLDRGSPAFHGPASHAVSRYFSTLGASRPKWGGPPLAGAAGAVAGPGNGRLGADEPLPEPRIGELDALTPHRSARHGTGAMVIEAACVTDAHGEPAWTAPIGGTVCIHMVIRARSPIARPRCGLRLHDRMATNVFSAGTDHLGLTLPALEAGQGLRVRFDLTLSVRPGAYTLSLGASEANASDPEGPGAIHDQIDGVGPIQVAPPTSGRLPFHGLARLPLRGSVSPLGHPALAPPGPPA